MSELAGGSGLGLLFAVVLALSASAMVASVGYVVLDRAGMRAKLREIDDLYNLVDLRDQELMLELSDRIAAPFLRALTRLGWRFSPAGRIDEIRSMLRRAGRPEADTDRYLAMRVLAILVSPLAAFVGWTLTSGFGALLQLAATGIAVACCTILPSRNLRAKVEKREAAIRRQLPDVMDLLIICMEAGLGFTSAVGRMVTNVEGELADEFSIALGEMRAGATRSDALGGLAERVQLPEIASFVMAVRQADKFGVSVSTVLRSQAEDMRVARKQAAQEKAMKAPVKMLIPMVFCIFPPMFIVVIGPAGLTMASLGK